MLTTRVFAVRALMVDGVKVDLLLFHRKADAVEYKRYVESCRLLGYEAVKVVKRHIIGPRPHDEMTPPTCV